MNGKPTKQILEGDSRELLKELPENFVDSVVCDPPYHLASITKRTGKPNSAEIQYGLDGAFRRATKGFMGMTWDGGDIAFDPSFWAEVLRVMKPGAHLLAFGGTRTYHRLACAIEDAGFELRDVITYHYASGMPKSHNTGLAIDKLNGVCGNRGRAIPVASKVQPNGTALVHTEDIGAYQGISEDGKRYSGCGTGLKPATELICLARKPLSESSVARNVLKWGTGALNIDAGRIGTSDADYTGNCPGRRGHEENRGRVSDYGMTAGKGSDKGRWPANLILHCPCEGIHEEGCPVAALDAQGGSLKSGAWNGKRNTPKFQSIYQEFEGAKESGSAGDEGTTSRFFFTAKPSTAERGEKNIHPTVKPVSLMKYLVGIACPAGGITLDPFAGSGTTGVACEILGFDYILMEREAKYLEIIKGRTGKAFSYVDDEEVKDDGQMGLFSEATA